jgi:hypothetical protein
MVNLTMQAAKIGIMSPTQNSKSSKIVIFATFTNENIIISIPGYYACRAVYNKLGI